MTVLSLADPLQSNDSTILRLVDDTGLYNIDTNTGGWGTPNTDLADIVSINDVTVGKYHLVLDVSLTTHDNTNITYDRLDLNALFGPFTSIEELIFDLTYDVLKENGQIFGGTDSRLLDGWYVLTYKLLNASTSTEVSSVVINILIDGVARTAVYQKLRAVPYSTDFDRFNYTPEEFKTIIKPIYYYSLFRGMIAELTYAKKEEILNTLSVLKQLIS